MHRRNFLKAGLGAASVAAVMDTAVVRADKKAQQIAEGLRTKIASRPSGSRVPTSSRSSELPPPDSPRSRHWAAAPGRTRRRYASGARNWACCAGRSEAKWVSINDGAPTIRKPPAVCGSGQGGHRECQGDRLEASPVPVGPVRQGVSKDEQMEALVQAGKLVAPLLEEAGIVMVWETLNVLVDHAGYFLVYSADGAELVQRTGHPTSSSCLTSTTSRSARET